MHQPTSDDEKSIDDIREWVLRRLTYREHTLPPLGRPAELPDITEAGIGIGAAWAVLRDEVMPTAIPSDHPRNFAFIPGSPTVASVLADLVVSASGVYAGSALEGGALVVAERAALQWLSGLVGLPETAHGTFVSGGSIANLSALVAARWSVTERLGLTPSARSAPRVIVTGTGAHASVQSAADIMGCELVAAGDDRGRLDGPSLEKLLSEIDVSQVVAVAATAGATNNGAVDGLAGIAAVCREHGLWLHVDAAYGGGALLSARTRPLFDGIELCDSITIDPHKWFFTPFDCSAVIYRDPRLARRAHTQVADYLDVYADDDNPADYAVHLSRRARGVPLWMSLLSYGVGQYREAVDRCLDLAQYAATRIAASDHLELATAPNLSVVVLRRIGWDAATYANWSRQAITSGLGLVTSTTYLDETTLRLCFVNPTTTEDDIDRILLALL